MKNEKSLEWVTCIKGIAQKQPDGHFFAKDNAGKSLLFEWQVRDATSSDFAQAMKGEQELSARIFADVETSFLRQHPEAINEHLFSTTVSSFFEKGIAAVDWQGVQEKLYETIKSFYEVHPSHFNANDTFIFVKAKDEKTGALLGFITFLTIPLFVYGDVRVTGMGVVPELRRRGIGKLLMSSIFSILPDVKRILLMTRITNDVAIKVYKSWGFVRDDNPYEMPHHTNVNQDHWINLQYKSQLGGLLEVDKQ